jgi:CRISPR-associated protein Cst2
MYSKKIKKWRFKMNNNIKGIELVWLSHTDLTNLNSGEGGTNFIDVKKYKSGKVEYPYVSGQAMRFYLRESIRRGLKMNEYMCVPDDAGENCGDPKKCINCDLFGYMQPEKGKGAKVRVSPVKVAPAMGLLPIDDNSTLDFLTRKKHKPETEKAGGDIVNVELGVNLYKSGISIDLKRVGMEEYYDDDKKVLNENVYIDEEQKKSRIIDALKGVMLISDYSKQSRLLTDFTPDIILGSLQQVYSHRLQKAFILDQNKMLNVERFNVIVKELQNYCSLFFGIIPGVIKNESEIKTEAKKLDLEILTPTDVINKIVEKIK